MDNLARLRIPQELVFGSASAETLGEYARQLGAGPILLISDRGLETAGLVDQAVSWLKKSDLAAEIYLEVEAEPSVPSVAKCLTQARTAKPDVVIGIGGGSVLDTAKAVAMLLTNEGTLSDYLGTGLVKRRGVPTILLPTTAGTGAEITPNALFYVPELRAKKAVVSPLIVPDVAIVDPTLTLSAPPALTAATGLDALCHAIESYTGLNATPLSRPFASEAIKQIGRNLRTAVITGDNQEARQGMALGSMYAAISIANSGTNAVHALAYPLQGLNRIQHGVANSLLLPYVMAFNMLGDLDRFAEVASLLGVPIAHLSRRDAARASVTFCKTLSQDIGIPQRMSEVGVSEEQLNELIDGALEVQRLLKNNPRPITRDDIETIYKQAL
jgi:alcohol dehydrogenase class IV